MPDKPKVKLRGTERNVFSLLSRARFKMKKSGMASESIELTKRVKEAESEDEAISTIKEYVELV